MCVPQLKLVLGYITTMYSTQCYFTIIIKLNIRHLTFLQIDIPTHLEDSFYRGEVYVGFKNAVTQPSSALRHATELKEILESRNGNCTLSYYIPSFTEAIY